MAFWSAQTAGSRPFPKNIQWFHIYKCGNAVSSCGHWPGSVLACNSDTRPSTKSCHKHVIWTDRNATRACDTYEYECISGLQKHYPPTFYPGDWVGLIPVWAVAFLDEWMWLWGWSQLHPHGPLKKNEDFKNLSTLTQQRHLCRLLVKRIFTRQHEQFGPHHHYRFSTRLHRCPTTWSLTDFPPTNGLPKHTTTWD